MVGWMVLVQICLLGGLFILKNLLGFTPFFSPLFYLLLNLFSLCFSCKVITEMMSVRKAIKITKNSYFQDTKEKLKAEATTTDSLPIPSRFGEYVYPPTFSMDDFEGNSVLFCGCGMPAPRFTLGLPRF